MKKKSTPEQLAAHNKKLLYTYFKNIYRGQDQYKAWSGSSPTPSFAPEQVFSTYFAVQSCKDYSQNTAHIANRKTAHQVMKEINQEIENVLQLVRDGITLTKENTKLYYLFEKYKNHSSEDLGSSSVFNGKKALTKSLFYWVLVNFEKIKNYYDHMIERIQAGDDSWVLSIIRSNLPRTHIRFQPSRDLAQSWGALHMFFGDSLKIRAHCFRARTDIKDSLDFALYYDKNPDPYYYSELRARRYRSELYKLQWYDAVEHDLYSEVIGYSPKWWEHTDLGAVCKLISESIKLKNIGKIEFISNEILAKPSSEVIRFIRNNITELDKFSELLKVAAGLEILEAKYHYYGPKNKACSPATKTDLVKENETPPSPHWHKVYSSAILDMRQTLHDSNSKPFKIFSSQQPLEDSSTDKVKQHLMTKDSRYLTFYSSSPKWEENYHPGLPMIFIPGSDYVAPEVIADESSTPSRNYSGKYGISVYSYPPAICNLAINKHPQIKRPHRIWK